MPTSARPMIDQPMVVTKATALIAHRTTVDRPRRPYPTVRPRNLGVALTNPRVERPKKRNVRPKNLPTAAPDQYSLFPRKRTPLQVALAPFLILVAPLRAVLPTQLVKRF